MLSLLVGEFDEDAREAVVRLVVALRILVLQLDLVDVALGDHLEQYGHLPLVGN